jgi:hypothetical protein
MTERKRRGRRTNMFDLWQNVLEDTKDFVDDSIDRVRDDDGYDVDVTDDIEELKKAVAELNTKIDRIAATK